MFKKLMDKAQMLGQHIDTEWAEEHSKLYDEFDAEINKVYDDGKITEEQFDALAITAFYDYADMKCDYI